jgi:two-component system cell cycle response regulator
LEARYLKTVLLEYSYWDEAYQEIVLEVDETWIEENSGQYLIDEHGFDFSLAIKADDQLAHLSINNEIPELKFAQLMSGGLKDLIAASLQNASRGADRGWLCHGWQGYLFSRFEPI